MTNLLFDHWQSGPYQQSLRVWVSDDGNALPVKIGCMEGDPERYSSHAMTVGNAEMLHRQLGKAIKAAKKADLE